jgi:hypothetical protein
MDRFCWSLAELLDFYIERARGDISNNARIFKNEVLLKDLHILMVRVIKIKEDLDFRSLIQPQTYFVGEKDVNSFKVILWENPAILSGLPPYSEFELPEPSLGWLVIPAVERAAKTEIRLAIVTYIDRYGRGLRNYL